MVTMMRDNNKHLFGFGNFGLVVVASRRELAAVGGALEINDHIVEDCRRSSSFPNPLGSFMVLPDGPGRSGSHRSGHGAAISRLRKSMGMQMRR